MAAIQPQGSRAGIITWLVVFVILTLVASIFAIYYNVEWRKASQDYTSLKQKFADIIPDSEVNGADVQAIKEARNDPAYQAMKVFQIAVAQRNELAKMITGAQPSGGNVAKDAIEKARATLADALKAAGEGVKLSSTTEDLNAAVSTFASTIAARDGTIADMQKQLESARNSAKATESRAAAAIQEREKQVEAVRKSEAATLLSANTDREAKQGQIESIEKDREGERTDHKDKLNKLQQSVEDKTRQLVDAQREIERLRAKLTARRGDVTGPITRASDGNIVRVANTTSVFINLGYGDQIVPGLTFEVYDKSEGVPPVGDGTREDEMPVGKGAIEVLHVGATSSECRVVKMTGGTTIAEGDVIANLVYDANTKYNFVIHGSYDLDGDGRTSSSDTEIVKRLVVQWGGKVMDKITTDTDFVVLGKEPVIPEYSKDDLQDPIIAKQYEKLKKEVDDYAAIRQEARDLHIPVLNQNRFLYYTGYYEIARK